MFQDWLVGIHLEFVDSLWWYSWNHCCDSLRSWVAEGTWSYKSWPESVEHRRELCWPICNWISQKIARSKWGSYIFLNQRFRKRKKKNQPTHWGIIRTSIHRFTPQMPVMAAGPGKDLEQKAENPNQVFHMGGRSCHWAITAASWSLCCQETGARS